MRAVLARRPGRSTGFGPESLTTLEAILTANNADPSAVTLDVPIGAAGQKIEADG